MSRAVLMKSQWKSALVLAFAVSASAGAQEREQEVPKDALPPAGMCRIWLPGIPARQQPAPTDCATAVKNRPAKARVLFGEGVDKKKAPFTKEFTRRKPDEG